MGIAGVVVIELFDLAVKREADMLGDSVFEKLGFNEKKEASFWIISLRWGVRNDRPVPKR